MAGIPTKAACAAIEGWFLLMVQKLRAKDTVASELTTQAMSILRARSGMSGPSSTRFLRRRCRHFHCGRSLCNGKPPVWVCCLYRNSRKSGTYSWCMQAVLFLACRQPSPVANPLPD